jgi:hypothetical protein
LSARPDSLSGKRVAMPSLNVSAEFLLERIAAALRCVSRFCSESANRGIPSKRDVRDSDEMSALRTR